MLRFRSWHSFIMLLFLIPGFSPAFAQYYFAATITDNARAPLGAATIALFKTTDSSLQKIVLSEDNGTFRFDGLSSKAYYIRVTHINYKDTGFAIDMAMLSANDITIQLSANAKDLGGITINGAKPMIEHFVDRTVFNVENSVAAIGADALEVLQKAPRVIVNGNDISIAGKSSVKLMFNDHMLELSGEDLVEFLRSIAADDISKIEIITTPPAAYDAAGNSGIINIVLKKSRRKGFNGNIRGGYAQTTYATGNFGGNLNYSNEKLNFYSTLFAQRGAEAVNESMVINYPSQLWTKYNTRKLEIAGINGTVGADYKLTPKTTAGIMYNGSYSEPDFNGQITNPIYNLTGNTDSTIKTHTHTIQSTASHSLNLDLQYLPGTSGRKITVDGDYFLNTSDKNRDVYSDTYTPDTIRSSQTKSNATQQISVYTLKSDVKLPYSFATLMLGGKLSFIENNTPANYYNVINNVLYPDAGNTDHFIYKENTQALYVNATRELNKWTLQSGLRGEFTETGGSSQTLLQTNRNNYLQLFPSAYVTYKADDDNSFSATYGRRIDRPDYWRTNPFKFYSTPYYYQQGNPFLQPSYSNNIELTDNYKDILTTTLFLHNATRGIDEITEVSGTNNLIVISYSNYLTIYTYGLSESVSYSKVKWLESNSQVTLYHTDALSNYPGTAPYTRSFSCNLSTDNTIILNKSKTIMAEVNYTYQFPEADNLLKYKAHSSFDPGIKLMTRDKKWLFALNGTDVFRTEQLYYTTAINGISMHSYGYYDLRGVRANLSYKFGKNKTAIARHDAGNEEEAKRAK